MKSLMYLFRRYKLASSLNLLGLIFAFLGSYILLTQICFIGSYNHGIKDYENIRRVYIHGIMGEGAWIPTCSRLFADNLNKCPQVESVGYMRSYGEIPFDKDGSTVTSMAYLVSDDMLQVAGAELVDGTLDVSKTIDGDVIIPASLAEKYFGEVMVAGKSMKLSAGAEGTVVGVYKDFPKNSDFVNAVYLSLGKENEGNGNNFNYNVYIRTNSNVEEDVLNSAMKKILSDAMVSVYGESDEVKDYLNRIQFSSVSLDKTYLNGHDPEIDRGNMTVYYILWLAVVLLLLVALINFANFSMAQAPIRLRSINTRKVMGESTLSLRVQLVAEGVIVSLCAFAASMLLAACISKWERIGEYTLGSVAIPDNPGVILVLAVIGVIVGILSTLYSARYITSFQPALVLKGNYGLNPQGRILRQVLVGLQLVMAFVMVFFVGIIYCQRYYIYNSDYGYNKDEVLIADIVELPKTQHDALRSELEKINGVESASFSFGILGAGDQHMKWSRGNDDEYYYFEA